MTRTLNLKHYQEYLYDEPNNRADVKLGQYGTRLRQYDSIVLYALLSIAQTLKYVLRSYKH